MCFHQPGSGEVAECYVLNFEWRCFYSRDASSLVWIGSVNSIPVLATLDLLELCYGMWHVPCVTTGESLGFS